jgi:hypothetical protein
MEKKSSPGSESPPGRNWTDLETEALLAEFNFALTLETKALKKQANKEVSKLPIRNSSKKKKFSRRKATLSCKFASFYHISFGPEQTLPYSLTRYGNYIFLNFNLFREYSNFTGICTSYRVPGILTVGKKSFPLPKNTGVKNVLAPFPSNILAQKSIPSTKFPLSIHDGTENYFRLAVL